MTKSHRWRLPKREIYLKVLVSAFVLLFTVSAVQAADVDPQASFTAKPLSGLRPLLVFFDDLSTGNPLSWLWDFGDGHNSTRQSPAHIYLTGGTYDVSLAVSGDGTTDSTELTDYVEVIGPEVPLEFDITTIEPSMNVNQFFGRTDLGTELFNAEFFVFALGMTDETTFEWSFGDGSSGTTSEPETTHQYGPGIYTVSVSVRNTEAGDYEVTLPMNLVVIPGDFEGKWTDYFTMMPEGGENNVF